MGKDEKEVENQLNENKNTDKDVEIDRLQTKLVVQSEELEEANKRLKFAPTPAPLPKNQENLPEGMQDSDVKTSIRTMSNFIKEKMDQLNDLATMEVMIDTDVRMKKRLESIKKMGSAQHIKIRGQWKTIAPKMHLSALTGRKINNDEYEITFGVFHMDVKGNKVRYDHYAEIQLHDGSMIKRVTSAEFRTAYMVTERIKTGKAITREILMIDNVHGGNEDEKKV